MLNINKLLQALSEKRSVYTDYSDRKGYDPNFLEERIALPEIPEELLKKLAKLKDSDSYELKYTHFSIFFSAKRNLPYFSAVNLNGKVYMQLKEDFPDFDDRAKDKWILDHRLLDENLQMPTKFYDGNDFDLGHLVRRLDPVWGSSVKAAMVANDDTFHRTNITPQHKKYNRYGVWSNLENFALEKAKEDMLRMSIFAGPVFREDDKDFTSNDCTLKIPKEYWKIIVMKKKEDNKMSATGFILTQENLITNMFSAMFRMFKGKSDSYLEKVRTYQLPISRIENRTGLKFNLTEYDPMAAKTGIQDRLAYVLGTPGRVIEKKEDIKY